MLYFNQKFPQINPYDMKRLELYGNNMADYHLVTDLLPNLARLYFLYGVSNEVHLSALQQAILLGVGLQVNKNCHLSSFELFKISALTQVEW